MAGVSVRDTKFSVQLEKTSDNHERSDSLAGRWMNGQTVNPAPEIGQASIHQTKAQDVVVRFSRLAFRLAAALIPRALAASGEIAATFGFAT